MHAAMQLSIATLNLLGSADRWDERQPLVVSEFARLAPDLMALQEADFAAAQECAVAEGGPDGYAVHRAGESRPDYGNALLVRHGLDRPEAVRDGGDRVELDDERSGVVVDLTLPSDAARLRVMSTHLHWVPDERRVRLDEVRRLLEELAERPAADATLIAGDLNATPDEPACDALREAGFRSAYEAANGGEPEWTYPNPATPADVAVRPPSCLDYIWVAGAARVVAARTVFETPPRDDPTLYPSDHRGLLAVLEIG
ncbi:MAG TPA: endonuclease/exonuclease/phosphatase family protein [Candidatus Limnocylindria bacterium]|jgi:endonuclease/exonuclease/phosphatase family metal-dependent hydrolase|nr:endonuclease/exonuclease/phosphatase family protein [Candidatus Limnocylindria bacterium]